MFAVQYKLFGEQRMKISIQILLIGGIRTASSLKKTGTAIRSCVIYFRVRVRSSALDLISISYLARIISSTEIGTIARSLFCHRHVSSQCRNGFGPRITPLYIIALFLFTEPSRQSKNLQIQQFASILDFPTADYN